MTRKRTANRSTLLAIAGAALLTAGVLLVAPEASAQRSGRGSVKHSSKAKPSKADPGRASPGRSTPGTAGRSRPGRGTPGPGVSPGRGVTPGRGAPARGGARAGRRADRRYSYRRDAWRDYRRWRAITGLIRLGAYYATRPTYSTTVVVTGTTYYYAGGVYYAHSGSGYVVVSAPPGAVVHAVPVSTTVVYVGATPYYYQNGTYYVATTQPAPPPPTETTVNVNVTVEGSGSGGEGEEPAEPEMTAGEDHNFEVVAPPAGATVPYVPEEADEETIAGKKYFVYDGAYYRPFVSDGETIYMVVEDPREAAA